MPFRLFLVKKHKHTEWMINNPEIFFIARLFYRLGNQSTLSANSVNKARELGIGKRAFQEITKA